MSRGGPGDGAPSTVPEVVVVGAGAAGLAVAAALQHRGLRPLVLDRDAAVGDVWRARYERLHLHTVRRHSALPGLALPGGLGRFVAAGDFADYLARYAEQHRIPVRARTPVVRVRPLDDAPARWGVELGSGERLPARTVVVATGRAHTATEPAWPSLGQYEGRYLPASRYRRGADHAGSAALVVGAGNSGGEIAVDLVESGAGTVDLAVRTPPEIVRRSLGPLWSAQQSGILLGGLPTGLLDRLGRILAAATVPDLAALGLARPEIGLATRVRRDGVVPLQDVGLIDAIRSGRVRVRPAVVDLTRDGARFADATTSRYDLVVAATGYRTALPSLVPPEHLDARGLPLARPAEAAAPGLFFAGYSVSLGGAIRDAAAEAPRIARAVARDLAVDGGGRRSHRVAS